MKSALAEIECLPGISPDIYGPKDFQAVQELVHTIVGIVLPPSKAMLVYSRLAPLVRQTGKGTFGAYIALIKEDHEERHRAICALTTNHTFFYREPHHFSHFAEEVRPTLLRMLDHHQPVRIWSAGCSSGEETWSLVMTLLGPDKSIGKRIGGQDIAVLATDIADHALNAAQAATYTADGLNAVPANLRQNWTKPGPEGVAIGQEAKDLVRFRSLNLLGEWPMKGQFDVIFCRNVMIYFDQPTKEKLIARFARQLKPGGFLYIGHSERVTGSAAAAFNLVGSTIYLKAAA